MKTARTKWQKPLPKRLSGDALRASLKRRQKQQRERRYKEREEIIADLRDACIGEIHASRLSDSEIHQRHGPTPQTIRNWRNKKTRFPQLATARMLLRAVGKDLAIVDYQP